MKMFSDCSGLCDDCYIHYIDGCLAGNDDDDFVEISFDLAQKLFKNSNLSEFMLKKLINKFPELTI